jgi:benzoate/toluate 1,2-dioxygenase alpha subunit/2,4,5-trichlorophenoxyacetic acid oxygenase 1
MDMEARPLTPFIDDRPSDGYLSVRSDAFCDPGLLELELKFIFQRTWNFLGLESQIPKPNDFITAHIGTASVLVTRTEEGKLAAFLNVCRHKGAQLCRSEQGNKKLHVCVYHAWAYDSSGRNVNVKNRDAGCYPESFDAQAHDLVPLPRLESYRGMIFGCMNADVPAIADYLGEFGKWLDLTFDQGPHGMEFVPGRSVYTFGANWKLQLDNGLDTYHLTTTHITYMNVLTRRHTEKTGNQSARQFDWRKRLSQTGGFFGFDYGHSSTWLNQAQPENRAIYPQIDEVASRIGKTKAEWVLRPRQALCFPNMQISDSSATMLRTYRPLAPDLTEMRVYCLAPIGEPADTRALRIRQFEDFFSASGFATPDDTITYEECQRGLASNPGQWLQGYFRGVTATIDGANAEAKEIGMVPSRSLSGPFEIQNEVAHHPAIREWARLIKAGIEGRPAYPISQQR